MIFDSHAHYDDGAFDADRAALLSALQQEGVCGVINAASDLCSAQRCIEYAATYPYMWAAVGVHPEAVDRMTAADIATLRALAAQPRVVAIGEIGLDYHYPDGAVRDRQIACFEWQLELARELNLPVIVHDRDAHEDTLQLLRKHHPRGVVHCFSGSVEMMQQVVALGMYIGLGGAVTFKNAKKPVAVARAVPADRLLLETDAPYMAPTPYRGMRCDSRMIAETAQVIAELRGEPSADLLRTTADNARRLFAIE